jgi:DNA (cytosine-5)-methyltransferase 1
MLQILELFGGIGSPRCALRNIGVPVKSIDYVEIDEAAVRTYNSIFRDDLHYRSQSVVGWNLKPDILIHGSPCQDISIAGHQNGADEGSETRSSLMWETIKIIQSMGVWKPRIVIWENVKAVTGKKMIKNYLRYISEMDKLGYTSNNEILDARDFGLPQARQRCFTVSMLNNQLFMFSQMERKPMRDIHEFLETTVPSYYEVTQPSMIKMINGEASNAFNGRVQVIKDYAMTITCKQMRCPNSGVIDIGNGKYRYLTERECWRLQGYLDTDYESALSVTPCKGNCLNSKLYKQAGNSIPVPIFESMFRTMLEG